MKVEIGNKSMNQGSKTSAPESEAVGGNSPHSEETSFLQEGKEQPLLLLEGGGRFCFWKLKHW